MNIFVLDADPERAAQYHCDRHVVKMILESVQIMNTALDSRGLSDYTFYASTHDSHPCVKWAAESWNNMEWLLQLTHYLNKEYRHRYEKSENHSSYQKVLDNWYDDGWLLPAEDEGYTDFAQAMPDDVKNADTVRAYRDYYQQYKASEDWFGYEKRRGEPKWLSV